jgi:hypothetical protein
MKRFMKLTATALSLAIALSATTVFAESVFDDIESDVEIVYENGDDEGEYAGDDESEELEETEENEEDDEITAMPTFLSFTGTVTEIEQLEYRSFAIHVEGENGVAVLMKNYNTFVMGEEPAVGDVITGFYASTAPMLLIYPPQYQVRLIVNTELEGELTIDRFELNKAETLVSTDGMLALNFTDDTEILLQDGQDFRASTAELGQDLMTELNNRLLVVTYGATTRSIPAQTIPGEDGSAVRIVVLFEDIVALGGLDIEVELDEEEIEEIEEAIEEIIEEIIENEEVELVWTQNQIVVNGNILDREWQSIGGAYLVPFRVVVDALGFGETITWNAETRTVTVSNGEAEIAFTIGSTSFEVNGETVNLDNAAILIDNSTYVPFRFFSEVFGMNNAYHFEGQVVIDNEESMQ